MDFKLHNYDLNLSQGQFKVKLWEQIVVNFLFITGNVTFALREILEMLTLVNNQRMHQAQKLNG